MTDDLNNGEGPGLLVSRTFWLAGVLCAILWITLIGALYRVGVY